MEAAFPLASFQVEQDFSATIQIAPPFGVFRIIQMIPGYAFTLLQSIENSHISRVCSHINLFALHILVKLF